MINGTASGEHPALRDLSLLRFLSPEVRRQVVERFVPAAYPFGSVIVREGEPADAFYVLVSGRARVVKSTGGGEEIALNSLRPGESFGEMGLLEQTTRRATVRASSDVEVLRLDRSTFDALLAGHPDLRKVLELQTAHRHLHNFLRHYTPFGKLPVAALEMLLAEMEPLTAARGELVIRQGDPPGAMYIVQEGHLRVFTQENGRAATWPTCGRGISSGRCRSSKARCVPPASRRSQRAGCSD